MRNVINVLNPIEAMRYFEAGEKFFLWENRRHPGEYLADPERPDMKGIDWHVAFTIKRKGSPPMNARMVSVSGLGRSSSLPFPHQPSQLPPHKNTEK